jgi:hypothetical protein
LSQSRSTACTTGTAQTCRWWEADNLLLLLLFFFGKKKDADGTILGVFFFFFFFSSSFLFVLHIPVRVVRVFADGALEAPFPGNVVAAAREPPLADFFGPVRDKCKPCARAALCAPVLPVPFVERKGAVAVLAVRHGIDARAVLLVRGPPGDIHARAQGLLRRPSLALDQPLLVIVIRLMDKKGHGFLLL